MKDQAQRFIQNPLLSPKDLKPSKDGLEIACLLNPGVFTFQEKSWLLVRVAERPKQQKGIISFPVLKGKGIEIIEIASDDPELNGSDPRVINYRGVDYLTTLSHCVCFAAMMESTFTNPKVIRFCKARPYRKLLE